jgi:hypothetical protein
MSVRRVLTASRVLKTGGLSFDGVDDYVKIEPFTVYGWSEITIAEWIYAVKPKANTLWSKFSMIGDYWTDHPATNHSTDNLMDYTSLTTAWFTRKPDGTCGGYGYHWISYVNQWVHVVGRFTAAREYSVWINGVKKYSVTVPANEKTVLEWNPDTATYPAYYKRFVLGANVGFGECMKCLYGEVRIYNRALSQDEILRIYNYGEIIRDGLVLLLDFTEYEGSIAYDKSGLGNHGTIYGAEWIIKKAKRVVSI